ncbi:HAD family hydrolase, partial [Candidatus Omnitrophota bacterium]
WFNVGGFYGGKPLVLLNCLTYNKAIVILGFDPFHSLPLPGFFLNIYFLSSQAVNLNANLKLNREYGFPFGTFRFIWKLFVSPNLFWHFVSFIPYYVLTQIKDTLRGKADFKPSVRKSPYFILGDKAIYKDNKFAIRIGATMLGLILLFAPFTPGLFLVYAPTYILLILAFMLAAYYFNSRPFVRDEKMTNKSWIVGIASLVFVWILTGTHLFGLLAVLSLGLFLKAKTLKDMRGESLINNTSIFTLICLFILFLNFQPFALLPMAVWIGFDVNKRRWFKDMARGGWYAFGKAWKKNAEGMGVYPVDGRRMIVWLPNPVVLILCFWLDSWWLWKGALPAVIIANIVVRAAIWWLLRRNYKKALKRLDANISSGGLDIDAYYTADKLAEKVGYKYGGYISRKAFNDAVETLTHELRMTHPVLTWEDFAVEPKGDYKARLQGISERLLQYIIKKHRNEYRELIDEIQDDLELERRDVETLLGLGEASNIVDEIKSLSITGDIIAKITDGLQDDLGLTENEVAPIWRLAGTNYLVQYPYGESEFEKPLIDDVIEKVEEVMVNKARRDLEKFILMLRKRGTITEDDKIKLLGLEADTRKVFVDEMRARVNGLGQGELINQVEYDALVGLKKESLDDFAASLKSRRILDDEDMEKIAAYQTDEEKTQAVQDLVERFMAWLWKKGYISDQEATDLVGIIHFAFVNFYKGKLLSAALRENIIDALASAGIPGQAQRKEIAEFLDKILRKVEGEGVVIGAEGLFKSVDKEFYFGILAVLTAWANRYVYKYLDSIEPQQPRAEPQESAFKISFRRNSPLRAHIEKSPQTEELEASEKNVLQWALEETVNRSEFESWLSLLENSPPLFITTEDEALLQDMVLQDSILRDGILTVPHIVIHRDLLAEDKKTALKGVLYYKLYRYLYPDFLIDQARRETEKFLTEDYSQNLANPSDSIISVMLDNQALMLELGQDWIGTSTQLGRLGKLKEFLDKAHAVLTQVRVLNLDSDANSNRNKQQKIIDCIFDGFSHPLREQRELVRIYLEACKERPSMSFSQLVRRIEEVVADDRKQAVEKYADGLRDKGHLSQQQREDFQEIIDREFDQFRQDPQAILGNVLRVKIPEALRQKPSFKKNGGYHPMHTALSEFMRGVVFQVEQMSLIGPFKAIAALRVLYSLDWFTATGPHPDYQELLKALSGKKASYMHAYKGLSEQQHLAMAQALIGDNPNFIDVILAQHHLGVVFEVCKKKETDEKERLFEQARVLLEENKDTLINANFKTGRPYPVWQFIRELQRQSLHVLGPVKMNELGKKLVKSDPTNAAEWQLLEWRRGTDTKAGDSVLLPTHDGEKTAVEITREDINNVVEQLNKRIAVTKPGSKERVRLEETKKAVEEVLSSIKAENGFVVISREDLAKIGDTLVSRLAMSSSGAGKGTRYAKNEFPTGKRTISDRAKGAYELYWDGRNISIIGIYLCQIAGINQKYDLTGDDKRRLLIYVSHLTTDIIDLLGAAGYQEKEPQTGIKTQVFEYTGVVGGDKKYPLDTYAPEVDIVLLGETSLIDKQSGEFVRNVEPIIPLEETIWPDAHDSGFIDLITSGEAFQYLSAGVEYVPVSNIDNRAATEDPCLLALMLLTNTPLVNEICAKVPGQKGGAPFKLKPEAMKDLKIDFGSVIKLLLEGFELDKAVDKVIGDSAKYTAQYAPLFNSASYIIGLTEYVYQAFYRQTEAYIALSKTQQEALDSDEVRKREIILEFLKSFYDTRDDEEENARLKYDLEALYRWKLQNWEAHKAVPAWNSTNLAGSLTGVVDTLFVEIPTGGEDTRFEPRKANILNDKQNKEFCEKLLQVNFRSTKIEDAVLFDVADGERLEKEGHLKYLQQTQQGRTIFELYKEAIEGNVKKKIEGTKNIQASVDRTKNRCKREEIVHYFGSFTVEVEVNGENVPTGEEGYAEKDRPAKIDIFFSLPHNATEDQAKKIKAFIWYREKDPEHKTRWGEYVEAEFERFQPGETPKADSKAVLTTRDKVVFTELGKYEFLLKLEDSQGSWVWEGGYGEERIIVVEEATAAPSAPAAPQSGTTDPHRVRPPPVIKTLKIKVDDPKAGQDVVVEAEIELEDNKDVNEENARALIEQGVVKARVYDEKCHAWVDARVFFDKLGSIWIQIKFIAEKFAQYTKIKIFNGDSGTEETLTRPIIVQSAEGSQESPVASYLELIVPAVKSAIKCVILDWGDVITRNDFNRAIDKLVELSGVSRDIASAFIEARHTQEDNAFYRYEHGLINEKQFAEETSAQLSKASGKNITLTQAEIEAVVKSVPVGSIPEVVALIQALRQRGYKVRMLTTTNKIIYDYLVKESGLLELFENGEKDIYASHLREFPKPDKRSYMEVVNDAGLSPEQCLFVDDRPDNVSGAEETGLYAYQFYPQQAEAGVQAIIALLTAHDNADKDIPENFSHLDQTLLDKIKDIFLTSTTVSKDLTALFDASDLKTLFPAMAESKNRTKFRALNVYDHTLLMIQMVECIEKSDIDGFNEHKQGWPVTDNEELFQSYVRSFAALTRNGEDTQMRAFIYFLVLFHDMGEVIDHQKHHIFSARMVTPWMLQAGYNDEKAEEARKIIASHVDLGSMFTASRTPEYLQSEKSLGIASLDEAVKIRYLGLLGLLTLVDVRSFNEGAFVDEPLMLFYLRVSEKGFLEALAKDFFDYRVRMGCSTPTHEFISQQYEQAQAALRELKLLLADDYQVFLEYLRSGIEVFNYTDYFFWGLSSGESLIKFFALFYVLTKEKNLRWAEITTDSGVGEMMGSLIEEHIIEKMTLEDIVKTPVFQLIETFEKQNVHVDYTQREGYGDIVKLRFEGITMAQLEAALNSMLQEALPEKQAPPEAPTKTPSITAERNGTTLKVILPGKLPQAVKDHPKTSARIIRNWIKSGRLRIALEGNTSPAEIKILENCRNIPFRQRKAWKRLKGIGGMFSSLIKVKTDSEGTFTNRQRHVLRGLEISVRYAKQQDQDLDEELIKKIAVLHQLGRLCFVHWVESKAAEFFPNLSDVASDARYNQPFVQDIIYQQSGITVPEAVRDDLNRYLLNNLDEVAGSEARIFFLADKILGFVEDFVLTYKLQHNGRSIVDDFEGRDEFLGFVFGSKNMTEIDALAIEDFDEFVVRTSLALMRRVVDAESLKVKEDAQARLTQYRKKYEEVLFPRVAEIGAAEKARSIFAGAVGALLARQPAGLSDAEKERNVFEKLLSLTEQQVLELSGLEQEEAFPEFTWSQAIPVTSESVTEIVFASVHFTIDLTKLVSGLYDVLHVRLYDDKAKLLGEQSVEIQDSTTSGQVTDFTIVSVESPKGTVEANNSVSVTVEIQPQGKDTLTRAEVIELIKAGQLTAQVCNTKASKGKKWAVAKVSYGRKNGNNVVLTVHFTADEGAQYTMVKVSLDDTSHQKKFDKPIDVTGSAKKKKVTKKKAKKKKTKKKAKK